MKYQYSLEQLISGQVSSRLRWLETLLITLAVPGLGYLINPQDLFFMGIDFPGLWLAPLLVALKYGLVYGVSSALMLTSGMVVMTYSQLLPSLEHPVMYSLGLLMVAFLSGEFSDVWQRRVQRLSKASHYLSERVKEVERAYLLIKISHDHLQKERVKQPLSLHNHSLQIRNQLCQLPSNDSAVSALRAMAEQLIQLFVHFGKLSVASLHGVSEQGLVEEKPLSIFGAVVEIRADDPLLLEALQTQKVVSLHGQRREKKGEPGRLLVVVPVVDLKKKVWAVLVVQQMPFWIFHTNNLQTLSVIGNHVGDLLCNQIRMGRDLRHKGLFIAELKRCISDRQQYGLEAMLLDFRFDNAVEAKVLKRWVVKHRPGLSLFSGHRRFNRLDSVLMLLPLMGEQECRLYLQQLTREVEEQFGFLNLRLAGVTVVYREIRGSDHCKALLRELLSSEKGFDLSSRTYSNASQAHLAEVSEM